MSWVDSENPIKFLQDNPNYINELDDISLTSLLFTDKKIKKVIKTFVMKNYYNRIKLLEFKYISVFLNNISDENINIFNDYLNDLLPTLSGRDFDQLLYLNFHYHEISHLYEFITNQEWYKEGLKNKEPKYVIYDLGYKLEQLLNQEHIDSSSLDLLENEVLKFLEYEYSGSIMPDMIIKNYLSLLRHHSPSLLDRFEKKGYEIIDRNISNNKAISLNMLIFIMHILNKNNIVTYIQFNDSVENDSSLASFNVDSIEVSLGAVDKIYNVFGNNNVASLYMLFLIGHEYRHAKQQDYIKSYKNLPLNHDYIEELTMYNCGISSFCTSTKMRQFYHDNHAHFTHEYDATINGLKFVYEKLTVLKSIDQTAIRIFNQSILSQLYSAFVFSNQDNNIYSPIEFVESIYKKNKNNLPQYARIHLLNNQIDLPEHLKEIESNLSEEQKLELGYINIYVPFLWYVTSRGIPIDNIFADIPRIYEEMYGNFGKK